MKKREITLLTDFIIQDLTADELEKRYELAGSIMLCKQGGGGGGCGYIVGIPDPCTFTIEKPCPMDYCRILQ